MNPSRRHFLRSLGLAATVSGLAGCQSEGIDSADTATTQRTTSTTEVPTTQSSTETTTETETPEPEPEWLDAVPVDAPYYIQTLKEADASFTADEIRDVLTGVDDDHHQGAVQLADQLIDVNIGDETYGLAKSLYIHAEEVQDATGIDTTEFILDRIPGQINVSDQEFAFIQPVPNGEPLEPVIHGEAYNGLETYNPENPQASSYSMQRLAVDGDYELMFNHQMNSVMRFRGGLDDEDLYEDSVEIFLENWSASMLGITADENPKLRPKTYEDGFRWGVSRGFSSPAVPEELQEEIPNGGGSDVLYSAAEKLQQAYWDSEHDGNDQWTGFELEFANGQAQLTLQDIGLRDPL